MFQCVGYDIRPAGRLRINGVERTESAQMRMVTVTFFQQQTVPQSDFIVHDRRLRQFFADLEPERIGRFSQQFRCFEQVFRQAMKSRIVTNAHDIVAGKMPDLETKDNDFFFMKRMIRPVEEASYMTLDEYRNIRSPLPTVQSIREEEETRAAESKPMSEDEMKAALLAKFGSKYKK